MRLSLAATVALANISAVSSAALVQQQQQGTVNLISIMLQVSKVTQEKAIDVWDHDSKSILAQSCSDSLQHGLFQQDAIAFQTDEKYGAGNFTLGSKSFVISDDPNLNQDASCTRIVSDDEFVITCHVPFVVPATAPAAAAVRRGLNDCFHKAGSVDLLSVAQGFEAGAQDSQSLAALSSQQLAFVNDTATDEEKRDLDKRQAGQCSIWTQVTNRVGNGNPHQNPWNVQVSQPMQCPGHIGCSVGHGTSYEVGWSANVGLVYQWISAGFAVQASVQTGNEYTCHGDKGQYFAVWRKIGTTAYTVRNGNYNSCTGTQPTGSNFIIWSPNSNNVGSYFYCVYGKSAVRWMGDRWLDKSANNPGGP
ncbi:hypothetical protein QBC37DRAFT_460505 [Rhypophila decipiens]|uniref:Uncharacterized protein n=1 Tax=Rhypophila decipiens TaxID=261697 RepID=A0AAN7B0C0_9PEZI|nr:hypothetical protein QBC37DRAFT_460505 [Rhypophila decipiens]